MNCFYCDREATKFCDFVPDRTPCDDPFAWPTCDRPLCDEHATCAGPIFFDGTDEQGRRAGWVDSLDYCPAHKDYPGGFAPDWDGPVGGGRAA